MKKLFFQSTSLLLSVSLLSGCFVSSEKSTAEETVLLSTENIHSAAPKLPRYFALKRDILNAVPEKTLVFHATGNSFSEENVSSIADFFEEYLLPENGVSPEDIGEIEETKEFLAQIRRMTETSTEYSFWLQVKREAPVQVSKEFVDPVAVLGQDVCVQGGASLDYEYLKTAVEQEGMSFSDLLTQVKSVQDSGVIPETLDVSLRKKGENIVVNILSDACEKEDVEGFLDVKKWVQENDANTFFQWDKAFFTTLFKKDFESWKDEFATEFNEEIEKDKEAPIEIEKLKKLIELVREPLFNLNFVRVFTESEKQIYITSNKGGFNRKSEHYILFENGEVAEMYERAKRGDADAKILWGDKTTELVIHSFVSGKEVHLSEEWDNAKYPSVMADFGVLPLVAVVGILATGATAVYESAQEKAQYSIQQADYFALRSALDMYHMDYAHYPESLFLLVEQGYIYEIPFHPVTGAPYYYEVNEDRSSYFLDTGLENKTMIPNTSFIEKLLK
jgi:hypothetical protein